MEINPSFQRLVEQANIHLRQLSRAKERYHFLTRSEMNEIPDDLAGLMEVMRMADLAPTHLGIGEEEFEKTVDFVRAMGSWQDHCRFVVEA